MPDLTDGQRSSGFSKSEVILFFLSFLYFIGTTAYIHSWAVYASGAKFVFPLSNSINSQLFFFGEIQFIAVSLFLLVRALRGSNNTDPVVNPGKKTNPLWFVILPVLYIAMSISLNFLIQMMPSLLMMLGQDSEGASVSFLSLIIFEIIAFIPFLYIIIRTMAISPRGKWWIILSVYIIPASLLLCNVIVGTVYSTFVGIG
jgi:hypothetical protein